MEMITGGLWVCLQYGVLKIILELLMIKITSSPLQVHEKLYSKLTRAECLDWLSRNDPEYDWKSTGATASQLRQAIGDNLQSFGTLVQCHGLRARFPMECRNNS
jgi:hypothetical protein